MLRRYLALVNPLPQSRSGVSTNVILIVMIIIMAMTCVRTLLTIVIASIVLIPMLTRLKPSV